MCKIAGPCESQSSLPRRSRCFVWLRLRSSTLDFLNSRRIVDASKRSSISLQPHILGSLEDLSVELREWHGEDAAAILAGQFFMSKKLRKQYPIHEEYEVNLFRGRIWTPSFTRAFRSVSIATPRRVLIVVSDWPDWKLWVAATILRRLLVSSRPDMRSPSGGGGGGGQLMVPGLPIVREPK